MNGARAGAVEALKGVADCDRLGAERWGRSNSQKLSGWRGGERERRRHMRGVEGRLAEEVRLESVSAGEMLAWRCRSAIASSSDNVGEGVGVGEGTGEG